MGFFSSTATAAIDRSSRRWTVAVHEAAHVVVGLKLGWTLDFARIVGRRGGTKVDPPRRIEVTRYHREDAIISLAGVCASARHRWFLPGGCDEDEEYAAATLHGTGISYGAAKREARRLVDRHWSEILRVAERLYRDGEL